MQSLAVFSSLFLVLLFNSVINCVEEHVLEEQKLFSVELLGEKAVEQQPKQREHHVVKQAPKLDERSKAKLLEKQSESLLFDKFVDFFVNNPVTKFEREQCFSKVKPGESIDFVIDLAPSPSHDAVDRLLAEESPIALWVERTYRTASRAYFGAVELFIEAVTYGLKPEQTHSVIWQDGRKVFLRGRSVNQSSLSHADFKDMARNLLTLWPSATKSSPETFLRRIVTNNLGRMTYLALWNRDNGLPTVLASSRRSKPVYTIVITDGASGAKLRDLTDDLSRTTLIDIGNHRFVNRVAWQDLKQLANFFTLLAPQQLPMLYDTTRMTACCICLK